MVTLLHTGSELYFPASHDDDTQLSKTTHLGIGAHPDDLEILAIHGILDSYDDPTHTFSGITVTNGKVAPRSSIYAVMSDDEYCKIRYMEQKKAAKIGKYNAQLFLNYDSSEIKTDHAKDFVQDLKTIITITSPTIIYTHNLADRHDTHIAVALNVIKALRELNKMPENFRLLGCEVWGDLDWLPDEQKVALDVSAHPELQRDLLLVYESQLVGNKNYAEAINGRRIANATLSDPYSAKHAQRVQFAMDLTALINHPEISIDQFISNSIQTFGKTVRDRLNRLRGITEISSN